MKSIFAVVTVLISSLVFAQELESSTLWKIEGKGLSQPSYLFGTIHITCDATLSEKVKTALHDTSQLVLELDMDDPELQTAMLEGMYMTNGKSLRDYVTAEEFEIIDNLFMNNLGVSVKMMQNVKPFFLGASLYPLMIDCPIQSIENELMKVTLEQNEEIFGLETIEDQIQVFEDIPYESQIKDLLRTAKDNLEYDKATFKKLMEVYGKEDINAMNELMYDENYISVAEHQDKLLDRRNKKWIRKIEAFAKANATFFGVGAGHLAGENGVINLLRKQGYQVTAVQ